MHNSDGRWAAGHHLHSHHCRGCVETHWATGRGPLQANFYRVTTPSFVSSVEEPGMRVEDGGKANRWAKDSIALQGDTIKGQMFRESGTSLLITGKAWCLSPLSWLIGADSKEEYRRVPPPLSKR